MSALHILNPKLSGNRNGIQEMRIFKHLHASPMDYV